jgi:HK97 family phage major capsid protein
MNNLAQLRTEQGQIQENIDRLANSLETEKRGFTEAEKTDLQNWKTRMAEIEAEAKPLQELQEMRGKKVENIPAKNSRGSEEAREISKYSLNKVIKARINNTPLEGREKEFAQEVQKRNAGAGIPAGGEYAIPSEVMMKRDYTATGTTTESLDQGGQLIETDKPGLIEALKPYMVLDQLGIRRLTGLTGNLSLPKELTTPTASWATETGGAASVAGLFDTVDLSPKRLPAYINYTMQMMAQPNLSIESYVRMRALLSIANAVQKATLAGTGSSNQPTGLITALLATGTATTGGSVIESAGTLDWDTVVDLEANVDVNDALMGSLAYLTNSYMRGALKTTKKDAGSGIFLWEGADSATPVNGNKVAITNHIPATVGTTVANGTNSPLIYGNFDHLALANWGDVYIDVINANAGSGYYQVVVNTFWDVAVLNTKSFSICADISLTSSFGS